MALTVGFVGGGRITRAMLRGWARAGRWPSRVVVSDTQPQALEALRAACPEVLTVLGDNAPIAGQDVVFLALHPPALRAVLGELRGELAPGSLVVSLAPKLTIADISAALGGFEHVARVIPNAPSIVGAGFNPMSFAPALKPAERQRLASLMAPLGAAPEVAEADLEAYAVLTAMGPTYLWFQLYELISLANEFGLERHAASKALAEMVRGTLLTMTESDLAPADVTDLVPVRPLAEDEPAIKNAYRARLRAVFDKIRPAVPAV